MTAKMFRINIPQIYKGRNYRTGHNSQKMSVTLSGAVAINPNNLPDEAFGTYLFKFDMDWDGVLSPAEIEAVTEIQYQ